MSHCPVPDTGGGEWAQLFPAPATPSRPLTVRASDSVNEPATPGTDLARSRRPLLRVARRRPRTEAPVWATAANLSLADDNAQTLYVPTSFHGYQAMLTDTTYEVKWRAIG